MPRAFHRRQLATALVALTLLLLGAVLPVAAGAAKTSSCPGFKLKGGDGVSGIYATNITCPAAKSIIRPSAKAATHAVSQGQAATASYKKNGFTCRGQTIATTPLAKLLWTFHCLRHNPSAASVTFNLTTPI